MQKKSKFSVFAFGLLIVIGLTFQPAISAYAVCPDDIFFYLKLDELTPTPGDTGDAYVDFIKDNDGAGNVNPTPVPAPDGVVNAAQRFNGTDTQINVPADNSFDWQANESFSIELWLKIDDATPPVAPNNYVAIGRDDAATDLQWWVGVTGDDGLASFTLRDTNGVGASIFGVGTIPVADGDWHHIVAVRDVANDQIILYVDTVEQGTDPDNSTVGFGSATSALNIGWLNLGAGFYFDGSLDEIALYDRALTLAEVQAHYNAGLAGNGVQTLRSPPVANAGADQDVTEGATGVSLDGSASTGNNITYAWTQTAGTNVALSNAAIASPTFTAPQVAAAGETLTFQLTVTDEDLQSTSDTVSITVVDSPAANAGADQNVTEGDTVTLNGTATGRNTTIAWTQTAGTNVTLSNAAVASPTFTAPQVAAAGETLTFQLEVTDDLGESATDTVSINVADDTALLQADAGADQTVAPGASVTLDGSASTGTNITYAWIQTAGTVVQLAGDDTAAPTFTAPAAADISAAVLDTLTFQLTVTDASGSATDTVNVVIDDSVGRSGGGGGGGGCFINSMF